MTALAVAILSLCPFLAACKRGLDFEAKFYYVCYDCPTDAVSASSISSLVSSYGGAGYIVLVDGDYYVTVSCYYTEREAASVVAALGEKQLPCKAVEAERSDYFVPAARAEYAEKLLSELKTLLSLSKICYDLANSMDEYAVDQSAAKSVLEDVRISLSALERRDALGGEVGRIIAECDDVSGGYILSRDVRRLQIVLCDAIINAEI